MTHRPMLVTARHANYPPGAILCEDCGTRWPCDRSDPLWSGRPTAIIRPEDIIPAPVAAAAEVRRLRRLTDRCATAACCSSLAALTAVIVAIIWRTS